MTDLETCLEVAQSQYSVLGLNKAARQGGGLQGIGHGVSQLV